MALSHLILATLLPLGAGGPPGTQASTPPERGLQSQGGWVFVLAPHVDLWFHGMATVDPLGPGPNPLYDPGYPGRVSRRKESAGVGQTPLDRRAGHFREAFRRDPAMEVLHFLPLYFPSAGRVEFLQALEALAESREGIPRAASLHTQFGLTAVGSVLPSATQRALLGEFVSNLGEEWDGFFAEDRRARLDRGEETRAGVQEAWDADFGPALAPLLRGLSLTGGTVFLTPAIGTEGRIFSGIPGNASDNVLAISAPEAGENPRTAVYSMIREISFPLARQALEAGSGSRQNRTDAEGLAAHAAIRAGALALDRLLPEELPAYQQFFLSRVGRPPVSAEVLGAAFQEVYPLDEGQLSALREVLNTTITIGGEE